jgi:chromosome segregation ATPase
MQSGRDTLAGIEDALRDLKSQEAALAQELEAANRERAGLVAERLQRLRELASIRARDASADGVIDEADNLSQQVRAILEARLKTIEALRERQAKAEADRETQVRRQDELTKAVAGLEEQLDRFGAEARAALAADPEHKALAETHLGLAAMLEKAVAKAEQVARDEHEKGLPYRSDPLFMYLWRRQMGTPAYQAHGIVRVLDEWVAGLVRYPDARANYALLTEIPVRLRAHAEDLRRQTGAAKAALDEMEAKRTRELAGEDLVAELEGARSRQVELGRELEAINSELAETGGQLKLYAKGEDQSFQSAVTAYAAFLEREPLRRLMADASATDTAEDDRIVEEARQLGGRIDELEAANAGRRRRLDQITERKVELARLSSNFRRQRYDDAGSEFSDNPRTEDLLQLLLRGAITAAEYWARMQAQQSWRQRPGDPWRRQSGLPPFGGFPGGWGGGWGGSEPDQHGAPSGGSGKDFETGGTF